MRACCVCVSVCMHENLFKIKNFRKRPLSCVPKPNNIAFIFNSINKPLSFYRYQ